MAEALNVSLITADARIKRSGIARCEVEVFDQLDGGVCGRAWPVGRVGSNPRPADYENYGPVHRAR